MKVVDVKEFSFTYPNGKTIFQNLSFSLDKGELLLLCGENGCGKSTLLRSLKEEVAPKGKKSGELLVNGQSAILFQECDKNIIFTNAWDDLIFPACNQGLPEAEIMERADKILSLFHITHLKHRQTATLSGGEKQLLALASVMMLEPDVLLLDEPLSQLDEAAKESFIERLLLIKAAGTAIIIAEHNTDKLLDMSDQVMIFDAGAVTHYHRDDYRNISAFPNAPEYIRLERKLGLPIRDFTREEALKNVLRVGEGIFFSPLERGAAAKDTVLTTRHLSFSYVSSIPVLEDVNFSLQQGEVACLVGKNGAGKSTLFYLLCDFLKAKSGEVSVAAGQRLGYLAQNPAYAFLKDSLREDFLYLLKKNRLPAERIEECFQKYTLFADLPELMESNPLDLSGGERAKAAIFKLLLLGRTILLLDEPEKHLDKHSMKALGHIIRSLSAQGVSFFIISHSPDFIYRCAHRILLLQGGKIEEYRPEDFFPTHSETALYSVIKPAKLPLFDCDEAEVRHG